MRILSDNSTGRGDAVTLLHSTCSSPSLNQLSLLVDTTNTAPAVQLKDQGILVQSVPEESQVSERDEQTKKFEELINKKQYKEIAELGKGMSDEELLKCLCQVVTTLDQFKGLYGYLKQRNMVPGFLAHGDMVLVREVIVETGLLETEHFGECDSIYDAIALSFKEDRHERVAGLFEAAQERPAWKDKFDWFVTGFFDKIPSREEQHATQAISYSSRRRVQQKASRHFRNYLRNLVWRLKWQLDNPASQKLLIDLVGQPSLLTPVAFARGFLYFADDTDRANFIKYGYKEAIEEGLKEEYP